MPDMTEQRTQKEQKLTRPVLSAGRARELIGRRDEAALGCTSALPLAAAAICEHEVGRSGRVEDGRGSLEPGGKRPVSHPRSSNRTCRSPASGSPTGFIVRHTASCRLHAAHVELARFAFALRYSFL